MNDDFEYYKLFEEEENGNTAVSGQDKEAVCDNTPPEFNPAAPSENHSPSSSKRPSSPNWWLGCLIPIVIFLLFVVFIGIQSSNSSPAEDTSFPRENEEVLDVLDEAIPEEENKPVLNSAALEALSFSDALSLIHKNGFTPRIFEYNAYGETNERTIEDIDSLSEEDLREYSYQIDTIENFDPQEKSVSLTISSAKVRSCRESRVELEKKLPLEDAVQFLEAYAQSSQYPFGFQITSYKAFALNPNWWTITGDCEVTYPSQATENLPFSGGVYLDQGRVEIGLLDIVS